MCSSKRTESPAQSWLCHGRVLLMPFKSLPFYPVWVLKRDQRSSALEATLPPPSPPSSVKCRADQPSYINVKRETMLFWGERGCRDVNAAGGRSLGHRHDTSAAAWPQTRAAWAQGLTKDRQQLYLLLTATAQLARMGRDLFLCL